MSSGGGRHTLAPLVKTEVSSGQFVPLLLTHTPPHTPTDLSAAGDQIRLTALASHSHSRWLACCRPETLAQSHTAEMIALNYCCCFIYLTLSFLMCCQWLMFLSTCLSLRHTQKKHSTAGWEHLCYYSAVKNYKSPHFRSTNYF